jgi:GNAT superfamily N-acetyltransferase
MTSPMTRRERPTSTGTGSSGGTHRQPWEDASDEYTFTSDTSGLDWAELSELYRLAPLGDKPPDRLAVVFGNSMFCCLVRRGQQLVGAGRALADGLDAAYLADIAVHPDHQGRGLGQDIVRSLVQQCSGHRKIILYANPGAEPFYRRLGFLPMTTAMAIWHDPVGGVAAGLLRDDA